MTEGKPKTLRLFCAIELADDVRVALASAIGMLKGLGPMEGLRWMRPEGVHLTLKFLGATPEERVPEVESALEGAGAGVAPFVLQPERLRPFHGGRHTPHEFALSREWYPHNFRGLWVGVAGDVDQLNTLAARTEDSLVPLGYPRERFGFFAHLTVARTRDNADRTAREEIYRALEPYIQPGKRADRREPMPAFPAFRVNHFILVSSTSAQGGSVYSPLAKFALTGE